MTIDVPHDEIPDDSADLESHPLTIERLHKYRSAIDEGGFPYSFSRTDTAEDLNVRYADLEPGEG